MGRGNCGRCRRFNGLMDGDRPVTSGGVSRHAIYHEIAAINDTIVGSMNLLLGFCIKLGMPPPVYIATATMLRANIKMNEVNIDVVHVLHPTQTQATDSTAPQHC